MIRGASGGDFDIVALSGGEDVDGEATIVAMSNKTVVLYDCDHTRCPVTPFETISKDEKSSRAQIE